MFLNFADNKYQHINNHKKISLSITQVKQYYFLNFFSAGRGTSRCTCKKAKKASLTVEAAAILPFFVCFMVFILYFFRILQVQAGVAQSLQYAGRKAASECSISKDTEKNIGINTEGQEGSTSDLGDLLKANMYFQQQLKKQNCPVQFIRGGIAGISFLQSDLSENYIELKAVYQMKLPINLLGNIQYRIVQEAKCRKWTGYQPSQDTDLDSDNTWLYYTEYGTVYHASRSCTHLDLSIQGVTYEQADKNRNSSGGKYHPCEKCGSSSSSRGMVYITNYGDRYHSSLTCSGLKRSIYMIRRSKVAGKRMCKKCGN